MTRDFFLFLARQRWMRRWMERSASARKLTKRFVAGDTLEDAAGAGEGLSGGKVFFSLGHLGANRTSLDDAAAARDAYLQALDKIAERKLPSTISLKLTQMGLDFSDDACLDNVRTLVKRASQANTRIEIDMESTAYTDRTLDVVEKVA